VQPAFATASLAAREELMSFQELIDPCAGAEIAFPLVFPRVSVERIWRREGLKVPQRQPKRGRLWFNDGSCIRLRPQYTGHVWSYDFVADRTHDGRAFRMLTVIDEHSRQCLAIHVQRKLRSDDVLAILTELFQRHGPPDHIRSDNGAEFTAHAVRDWLGRIGVKTL